MKKKYLSKVTVITFFLICSILVGCSNENPEEKDAIQVATKYKEIEYKVNGYHKVIIPEDIQAIADETKPYVTEDFFNSQIANRVTGLSLQIARSEKSSIKADKIHFESAQDEENGVLGLDYDLVLVLTNDQGTSKEIKLTGVLTMIKVNGKWKVKYDVNHNLKDLLNLAQARG
ncbi:hypothetical protein SAMN02799624_05026 [Paenibacillus sp. UNC496MF]|uniref:hypothetical protein n=1 Tax=Paenibacillus sp. UNC496MF TaxID=1502753 RepID=UPI0008EDA831|nr:hypothetical protein [Paenibacillus sp. UNC496MF]SFJ55982.1 hypothetical protein SAMN02799624_05026 [Paenibacillus sp. UNC496MF]